MIRKLKIARVKTIDDLLARSDVNATLEDFIKKKADVTDLIIIYKKSDGEIRVAQSGITNETELWMLEVAKQTLFENPE